VNPASVWPSASESTVSQARARREVWARARNDEQTQVTAPLDHLCVRVYVNVGSVHEHVPTWAEGIGLVRTELVFADRAGAPSEAEQFGALRAIASRVDGVPVVVRLFDAGGDKPLAWLRPPEGSTGARGIELLFMHPGILDAQLRAIGRTADRTDVRVLLPLVTGAGDVQRIRDRAGRPLPVGAMIETPAAVDQVDEIAEVSDFLCIGTNDLTAIVTGQRRVESGLSSDARVLGMIARVVEAGHRHGRKVTVCGEMAGEPHVARILVGLGVDSISVAPGRIAKVKLALRDVTMDDCRAVAREAMR
jgi:phosphoenolpyruvate-protein kinase (PTS system EI component)